MGHIPKDQIQEHIDGVERPDVVLPLDRVRQWTDREHLTEDPFPDRIGAPHKEQKQWFSSEEDEEAEVIQNCVKEAKKHKKNNETEAQWRNGVGSDLSRIKTRLGRWQLYHALRLCCEHGWLAQPLWHLSTDTQVKRLAKWATAQSPITEVEWDGGYRSGVRPKEFKSMGVTSRFDWKELAAQVAQIGLLDVEVDAGPIPPPHNGNPADGQRRFWIYRYRTGRIDATGRWTDLQHVTAKERAQSTDIDDIPPFTNANQFDHVQSTGPDHSTNADDVRKPTLHADKDQSMAHGSNDAPKQDMDADGHAADDAVGVDEDDPDAASADQQSESGDADASTSEQPEYRTISNTSDGDGLLSVRAVWPGLRDQWQSSDTEKPDSLGLPGKQRSYTCLLMHHRFTWDEASDANLPPVKLLDGMHRKGLIHDCARTDELVRPKPLLVPHYEHIISWNEEAQDWAEILHKDLKAFREDTAEAKAIAQS